jgi:hypothetical protein
MNPSLPPPQGQLFTASSLADVLYADEDIEDVGALRGNQAPEWLYRLPMLVGWQRVELSDKPAVPLVRMAMHGPRGDGGWAGAETISVFGYTGWPTFNEVLRNADGTLRTLGAVDIVTKVLPVPSARWVAALRSSGTALIDGRCVWAQQSNYVAGSEQPHAGRLVVHSIFIDDLYRSRLVADIAQMSNAVYHGFVAAVRIKPRAI